MPTPELIARARAAAAHHELEPALVCAVIEQESAWNTYAIRYEPGFRTRYVAPLGLPPTEEIARSISWGLMQVMGQVAREHGFTGKFLSALCDPALGLDSGCAALAAKFRLTIQQRSSARANVASEGSLSSGGSAGLQAREKSAELNEGFSPGAPEPGQGTALSEIAHALALWNGGSNPNYPAEVLARLPRYK